MKKSQSITSKLPAAGALILIGVLWLAVSEWELVPSFLLPSPVEVCRALVKDGPVLLENAGITLLEAAMGLGLGIAAALVLATAMHRFRLLYRALYPVLVITQTIPTIALAPLLVLWMGFGMSPKVTLVALTTFFPIAVSLLEGYASTDRAAADLLRSMGASRRQIFLHLEFPSALSHFFSGLRVSASYAVVGAVISEWLGGFQGLGVYMTRVKKAYAFDKMFAVIIVIVAVSLLLMALVTALRRRACPWEAFEKIERND
ncbi:ABC transporter permease [Flintibacter muris]|uniref:ABC transporter permease n=1 Tax=Flintibacter muris TaxID=2941327 RepID=UPI00203A6266|nr:ABC transporter permease [Flintibacter muris]